jgi:phosphohistidine phosphatase SixA
MYKNTPTKNRWLLGSLATLVVALIGACSKTEDPIIPLKTNEFDATPRIIGLSEKLSIKINQNVTWKTTAGSITQTTADTLTFMPPPTSGVYRITLKSVRDPKDSLNLTVIATARANVFKPMQKGGYVLAFRHAAAPANNDGTNNDQVNSTVPEWWKSCDSKLARQLNEQGKKDARDIGSILKTMQIPVGRLISSEFCRCFTTADLMALGIPTQQSKDLTLTVYDEPNRYGNTMKVVNTQPIDDKNSLLVIHAGFSGNYSPSGPLTTLNWGDAAVFQLQAGQTSRYVATLQVRDFTDLVK